jgi:hypothetical protein
MHASIQNVKVIELQNQKTHEVSNPTFKLKPQTFA